MRIIIFGVLMLASGMLLGMLGGVVTSCGLWEQHSIDVSDWVLIMLIAAILIMLRG